MPLIYASEVNSECLSPESLNTKLPFPPEKIRQVFCYIAMKNTE